MTSQSGVLVVKSNPAKRVRGTVDWMGTTTPIRSAFIGADGELQVEFSDDHTDHYEATHVQTRAGVEIYDDEDATEYLAHEVAILLPDGTLADLPAKRLARAAWFNDDAREVALADAANAALLAWESGGDLGEAMASLSAALAMGAISSPGALVQPPVQTSSAG